MMARRRGHQARMPWAHLDEPIYCEAVCAPEDVLYEGSDDDDYETPDDRRLRCEEAASRYWEGRPLSLQCTALNGPFDAASGWANPWQSRQRRYTKLKVQHHRPTTRPILEIAESPLQPTAAPVGDRNALKEGNAHCHLPSPESLSQAPVSDSHPFMDEDELVRVERWRSVVQPAKANEDDFWTSQTVQSGQKRSAEWPTWLKTVPNKKMRADFDEPGITSPQESPVRANKLQSAAYCSLRSFQANSVADAAHDSEDELSMVNIRVPRAVAAEMSTMAKATTTSEATLPPSDPRVLEDVKYDLLEAERLGAMEPKDTCMQATDSRPTIQSPDEHPEQLNQGANTSGCQEAEEAEETALDSQDADSSPEKTELAFGTRQDEASRFSVAKTTPSNVGVLTGTAVVTLAPSVSSEDWESISTTSSPASRGSDFVSVSQQANNLRIANVTETSVSTSHSEPSHAGGQDRTLYSDKPDSSNSLPITCDDGGSPAGEAFIPEALPLGPLGIDSVIGSPREVSFISGSVQPPSPPVCVTPKPSAEPGYRRALEVDTSRHDIKDDELLLEQATLPEVPTPMEPQELVTLEDRKPPSTPEPKQEEASADSQGGFSLRSIVQRLCSQSPWAKRTGLSQPCSQEMEEAHGTETGDLKGVGEHVDSGPGANETSSPDEFVNANSRQVTPESNAVPTGMVVVFPARPTQALTMSYNGGQRQSPFFTATTPTTPSYQQPPSCSQQQQQPPYFTSSQAGSSMWQDLFHPRHPPQLPEATAPQCTPETPDTASPFPPHYAAAYGPLHNTRRDSSVETKPVVVQTPFTKPTTAVDSQDPRIPSQFQTPWAKTQLGFLLAPGSAVSTPSIVVSPPVNIVSSQQDELPGDTSVVIPAEEQSPWTGGSQKLQLMAMEALSFDSISSDEVRSEPTLTRELPDTVAPLAPLQEETRPRIRTHLTFKDLVEGFTPRPERKRKSDGLQGSLKKMVRLAYNDPPGSTSGRHRRVSFAPLPHEEDISGGPATPTMVAKEGESNLGAKGVSLRASPPPETSISDIPDDEKTQFSNHFEAVNNRAKGIRQRILPTPSQQILGSPDTDAMANAFVKADGVQGKRQRSRSVYSMSSSSSEDEEDQEPDDAEDVLNNIEDYLGRPWDIAKALEEENALYRSL